MTEYPCHSLHLLWTALVYPDNYQAILTEHSLQDVSPYPQYTCNHNVNFSNSEKKNFNMCFQQIKHTGFTFWQTLSLVQKAGSELPDYLRYGTCTFQSAIETYLRNKIDKVIQC
jgi:hypothetical protein